MQKITILSAIIDYHLMFKVKAAMDQFMEGMEVLETLNDIRKNPSSFKNFFVYTRSMLEQYCDLTACLFMNWLSYQICFDQSWTSNSVVRTMLNMQLIRISTCLSKNVMMVDSL